MISASLAPLIQATIYDPDPILVEGRHGQRYWIRHPFPFTDNADVDERLAGYPLAVFQPQGRHPRETPVVVALQGMAAPYQWNAFLVPTLLDMGIACAMFDTPFAGERSLARNHRGNVVSEVIPLHEQRVTLRTSLVLSLMDAVAHDIQTVLSLLRERHGLCDGRVALFGVSLGTLLTAFAFTRDGVGRRLLGTLGHADLWQFVRSYSPFFTPLLASPPGRMLGELAGLWIGPMVPAALDFLTVLSELCTDGPCSVDSNPMTFSNRVGSDRRVRFLVGQNDPLVRPNDAVACASRFADGAAYIVPGLAHGNCKSGPTFVEHARTFVGTQLGDWRW